MEETKIKGSERAFQVVKWAALAISAAFIVCLAIILVPRAEVMGGFGGFLNVAYNTASLMIMVFFVFVLGLFLVKERRELFSKIMVWGVMLLAVLYTAKLFNILPDLAGATFETGLVSVAFYVPCLCAAVSLIALIAQWDVSNKEIANNVAMVASVVAVFLSAFYLFKKVTFSADYNLQAWATILWQILTFASYSIISVFVYFLTQNRRVFDKAIFGMTDEEAQIAEDVEDKVEAMVADIEDELLIDAAEDLEKDEAAEEAQEVVDEIEALLEKEEKKPRKKGKKAKAEEAVEEAEEVIEEVEEEIEEANEELLGDK